MLDGAPQTCASLPSSNSVPFGRWWHARSRGYCRGEPGSALSGGYAPNSARKGAEQLEHRARGVLSPWARESKARTERFLREKLISDHGLFFSYDSKQGAENGQDSWGIFKGCAELWTAGCWLARRLHQLKAYTTVDLGIFIFLISA